MCFKKDFCLLLLSVCLMPPHGDAANECLGAADGQTFIVPASECQRYIYCNDGQSYEGVCLPSQIFNRLTGQCGDPAGVPCADETAVITGADTKAPTLQLTTPLTPRTTTTSTTTTSTTTMTTTKAKSSSTTKKLQMTTPSSAASSSASATTVAVQMSGGPQLAPTTGSPYSPDASPCPKDANELYLPYANSCIAYYACYMGAAIAMQCAAGTHFNPPSGRCESASSSKCTTVGGVVVQSPLCAHGVYDFLPHPERCEYYYYCNNGTIMIYRCPSGFVWQTAHRSCVEDAQALCLTSRQTDTHHFAVAG